MRELGCARLPLQIPDRAVATPPEIAPRQARKPTCPMLEAGVYGGNKHCRDKSFFPGGSTFPKGAVAHVPLRLHGVMHTPRF